MRPGFPARADWREEVGTFRIGMLDIEAVKLSPGEMERIRAAFADALRIQTEIYRARDLPALVDALISGRVDYAMLTAAAYASAALTCSCVEPIAKAVSADGADGTRAVLFLAEGVNLSNIPVGKGIAVPGLDSFNAYGAALASLHTIVPGICPRCASWIINSGNMDAAIADFVTGKVDGFIIPVAANTQFGSEISANPGRRSRIARPRLRKVKPAWRSDPITNGPHAVRQSLAGEAKVALTDFLEKAGKSGSGPERHTAARRYCGISLRAKSGRISCLPSKWQRRWQLLRASQRLDDLLSFRSVSAAGAIQRIGNAWPEVIGFLHVDGCNAAAILGDCPAGHRQIIEVRTLRTPQRYSEF